MTTASIAYHEAGHAVAALLRGIAVRRVTVEPMADTAGHCPTAGLESADATSALIMICAGGAAQSRHEGRSIELDDRDLDQAAALASLVARTSLEDPTTRACLRRHQALAGAVVASNWTWIERTAQALLRRRTLDRGEVADLMM